MRTSLIATLISALLGFVAWIAPACALASCTDQSNHYVRSITALLEHQEIHRSNMQVLGIHLAWENSREYAATFPYLAGWLANHDTKKQKYIKLLCQIYGSDTHVLPYDAPERVNIRTMNAEEELQKTKYLKKVGLLDAAGNPVNDRARKIISQLREIEDVADKVERVANPVSGEELGKQRVVNGRPVSEMDPEYTFKFVAPDASKARRAQLRREYNDTLAFYKSRYVDFTGYARTLGSTNMARRTAYLTYAKARAKDYALLIKGAIALHPKNLSEALYRTSEGKTSCLLDILNGQFAPLRSR